MLEILDKPYSSPEKGLSSSEAEERLKKYGANTLAKEKKARPLRIFLGQFRDVMIMILLAATVVSFFLGEIYDAVTIIIIVLLNAVLGFAQEYKTEKTLLALKSMTAPSAKCYRDGALVSVPAAELVPGDVIRLEAGDKVPADAALLEAKGLLAEESILTGESAGVHKEAGSASDEDNSIGRSNIVYSGTVITKGAAEARVIATGINAQMGKISGMLTEIEEEMTPLQKRLAELGKIIAVICLVVCRRGWSGYTARRTGFRYAYDGNHHCYSRYSRGTSRNGNYSSRSCGRQNVKEKRSRSQASFRRDTRLRFGNMHRQDGYCYRK